MEFINKISKKQQLALLIILLVGLIVSVYLVLQQQVFKSKANIDISSSFYMDADSEVNCSGSVCTTESNNVTLYLKGDPDTLFSR